MRNVTISLNEEVARWVRIEAARRETSVSRLVGELLKELMSAKGSYDEARRQFFSVQPRPLGAEGERLPTREEIHDRESLR